MKLKTKYISYGLGRYIYLQKSWFFTKLLTNVRFLPFLREHNFENSEIFAKNREKEKTRNGFFSEVMSRQPLTSVQKLGEEGCQKHKIVDDGKRKSDRMFSEQRPPHG